MIYGARALKVVNKGGKDRASINQIMTLMDGTTNLRNKSLITMLKDSGLRSGDACLIQFKHIRHILENADLKWYTFEIEQEKMTDKTGHYANPVIGYDAIRYLLLYVEWMNQKGLDTSDDAYVYVSTEDRWYKGVLKPAGSQISSASVAAVFSWIKERLEISANISAHSLRKNHHSTLEYAKVPLNWITKMQGRDIGNSTGPYSKPNPDELIAHYKIAYPELSFDSLILDDAYTRMKDEVDGLRDQLNLREMQIESNEGPVLQMKDEIQALQKDLEIKDQNIDYLEVHYKEQNQEIIRLKQQRARYLGLSIFLVSFCV